MHKLGALVSYRCHFSEMWLVYRRRPTCWLVIMNSIQSLFAVQVVAELDLAGGVASTGFMGRGRSHPIAIGQVA